MMQESADAEGPVVEKIMSSRSVKKKVRHRKSPSLHGFKQTKHISAEAHLNLLNYFGCSIRLLWVFSSILMNRGDALEVSSDDI